MAIFTSAEDLKAFLGANIIGGLEVTDAGGLDITWVRGMIYDGGNDLNIEVAAGSDTVTDDDTTYLLWKSGTALELSAVTAAGVEVLVATIVAASGDISSITEAGFDFSSVSGLDGRPVIILDGDNEPGFSKEYGQIIIMNENLVNSIPKFSFRKEDYRNPIEVSYRGSGSKVIKNIIAQMDGVFKPNNKSQLKTYHYDIDGSWDTNYYVGVIKLFVDARKNMVPL